MQKPIQNSLIKAIAHQIWDINKSNAEISAIITKLSSQRLANKQSFIPKLQVMKAEICHQISQLTSNVNHIYKAMDIKIGVIIAKMSDFHQIQGEILRSSAQITQLEEKIHETQINLNAVLKKNKDLVYQNQLLKDRLQKLELKQCKKQNDCRMVSTKNEQESILSLKPPLNKVGIHFSKNNNSFNEINFHKNSLKSEQNSFSQMLAKQMSTMDQSLTPIIVQSNSIFKFACSSNPTNFHKSEQDPNCSEANHNHRLKYLLKNLKNSMEEQSSSFHRQSITSQHEGWGERKVKKYNI